MGADAYYRESVEDRQGDAGGVVEVRTLIIDSSVARASSIDTDDVITFTDPAGLTRTARAARVARGELAGIPDHLQTTRLELAER